MFGSHSNSIYTGLIGISNTGHQLGLQMYRPNWGVKMYGPDYYILIFSYLSNHILLVSQISFSISGDIMPKMHDHVRTGCCNLCTRVTNPGSSYVIQITVLQISSPTDDQGYHKNFRKFQHIVAGITTISRRLALSDQQKTGH